MKTVFEQTWWNNNLNNTSKYDEYLGWIGDTNAESRVAIRKKIKDYGVKSLADFGCGPCIEYMGLTSEGYEIKYLGIDSCTHLKEVNEKRNISFLNAPVEKTGLKANSYEVSYSRHVLEHLPTYEDALTEMIRVASKYVVHIFFIKPQAEDKVDYWEKDNLYHNTYSASNIESFLKKNKKVKSFEWIDINQKENALFITLIGDEK